MAELQTKLEAEGSGSAVVAVDIDDLFDGLRLGTAQFFTDALTDPARSAAIEAKSPLYFTAIRVEKPVGT